MKNASRHETLGNRLQRLRKERGWSQQVAATTAGIATATLSALENDNGDCSTSTLKKLAAAYGVSLAELFGNVEAA